MSSVVLGFKFLFFIFYFNDHRLRDIHNWKALLIYLFCFVSGYVPFRWILSITDSLQYHALVFLV